MSKRKAIKTSEKRAAAIMRKREWEIRREAESAAERRFLDGAGLVQRMGYDRFTGNERFQIGPVVPRDKVVMVRLAPIRNPLSDNMARRYMAVEYAFRAVVKAWGDGEGNEVQWVEWEPCGARAAGF